MNGQYRFAGDAFAPGKEPKKSGKTGCLVLLAMLLLPLAFCNCRKSGGSGAPPEPFNVAGTWSVYMTGQNFDCSDPALAGPIEDWGILTIDQVGADLDVILDLQWISMEGTGTVMGPDVHMILGKQWIAGTMALNLVFAGNSYEGTFTGDSIQCSSSGEVAGELE